MFKSFATALLICAAGLFALVHDISAQTTEFTYQGSLKDGPNPANANYDFEFALFDALNAGNPIGPTLQRNTVAVTNGIFAVKLDFGNQFPGVNRYLEIRVRQSGGGTLTTLSPRQIVNSSPYSVKTLNADNATNSTTATTAQTAVNATTATTANNALNLGGVAASQYVTGQVVRGINGVSDNVTLAPGANVTITPAGNTLTIASTGGGGNVILNQTTQQAGANFNISGDGTTGGTLSGNVVNTATKYNIGGSPVLSNTSTSTFVGISAGSHNTTGFNNSFVGQAAGFSNDCTHQQTDSSDLEQ